MKRKRGFSVIEVMIVAGIILIIVAIAIPSLLRASMRANEDAAIRSLNSLHEAALKYSVRCEGFPPSLEALGPPANGCATANLINAALASGKRNGYIFSYAAFDADADGRRERYRIIAAPAKIRGTGRYVFFTDQSGKVIRSPEFSPRK